MHFVRLSHEIIEKLNQADFQALSEWAVGIEHIDGLEEVKWPANINYSNPDFANRNAQYILNLFPNPKTYGAFYGKAVFDNWILLEDTTYDTLHKTPEGNPMFLDASIALGGLNWDDNQLKWTMINPNRSTYLVGSVTDLKKFEPWIKKIERRDNAEFDKLIGQIPKEWAVPESYLWSVSEFLASTSDDFLPMFREWIDLERGFFF